MGRKESYGYDVAGWMTSRVTPKCDTIRLIRVERPEGTITTITYNAWDQVTELEIRSYSSGWPSF